MTDVDRELKILGFRGEEYVGRLMSCRIASLRNLVRKARKERDQLKEVIRQTIVAISARTSNDTIFEIIDRLKGVLK